VTYAADEYSTSHAVIGAMPVMGKIKSHFNLLSILIALTIRFKHYMNNFTQCVIRYYFHSEFYSDTTQLNYTVSQKKHPRRF